MSLLDDTINLFLIFLVHDLHSPILLKYSPLFKAICPRTMVIVKLYNQNIYNMGHFPLLVEFGLQALYLYLIICVDEMCKKGGSLEVYNAPMLS